MDTWTTVTGYPYLTVLSENWCDTSVTFTLKQQRFLSDGTHDDTNTNLWCIPLLFASPGGISEEAVIMTNKEQTFTVIIPKKTSTNKIQFFQFLFIIYANFFPYDRIFVSLWFHTKLQLYTDSNIYY